MAVQLFKMLKAGAESLAQNGFLYDWALRGEAPDRFLVRPVDLWPGRADWGASIYEGQIPSHLSTHDMHAFGFLRDLRRFSREQGVNSRDVQQQSRYLIESWIANHSSSDDPGWVAHVCGQRIAAWISHYDFYAHHDRYASAFDDRLFDSLIRQSRHLSRVLLKSSNSAVSDERIFEALQGLLYAGLAFEGYEEWVSQALEDLRKALGRQIGADGLHLSRSTAVQVRVLQAIIDMRMALVAGGYPVPEILDRQIEAMGHALRFFRLNDKKLAVFHGAQESREDLLEMIFSQAGIRGKVKPRLVYSGFERMVQGRTTLLVDTGCLKAREYGHIAHSSPLAFEMTYGAARVFVNCGTHPISEDWRSCLRVSPAHNMLTLADQDAYEIKTNGSLYQKAAKISAHKEDGKDSVLLEASHEGYVSRTGFTHRRRLYLCDQGHNLRGDEHLFASNAPRSPMNFFVRFHLHPQVMVSLIRDGQEALMRLPGGAGWRFGLSGGVLALEDSIYLGDGVSPRKTKQLAIYGQITDKKHKIKWFMRKEG